MFISKVEIKNFRSFKEISVDFQQGLNVLLGPNNTGKTNLLQAIRHAIGPSASRGDSIWLDRDDFYKESAADKTERTISVSLTFSGLSDEQRASFFEIVDFDLANVNNSKAIIRFEATWPNDKRLPSIKRTGGALITESPEVSTKILELLPITFLPALRDAEASLAPGYKSRLALLLLELTKRNSGNSQAEIEGIYVRANDELEKHPLISDTKKSLQSTTSDLAGNDYIASAIKVAEIEFGKILRTLQIQMENAPIGGLTANGLGYNNLLYMAVVLEHLKQSDEDENPLFLIEEPEAHLHPQLTMLLADYLSNKTPGNSSPQTILTTHSPTLAASVPPNRINVLFFDSSTRQSKCNSIANAGLDERELNQLQRMMDITRATIYFAKSVILVEGISETLLIPILAKRLGHDLSKLHISVVPICGVAFEVFKKLLDPNALGIPIAIVTDGDPPVPTDSTWKDAVPEFEDGKFKVSDRTKKLTALFTGHATVKVYSSELTLEYDLAKAGDRNAATMADVWEGCFVGTPGTFNKKLLEQAGTTLETKALSAWRGICRANHTGSKAEFAHHLATALSTKDDTGKYTVPFDAPIYLQDAIEYVVKNVPKVATETEVPIT